MNKEIQKNIEVFNHIVLHVLIKLYDSFPKPIDIDPDKIGLDARPDATDRDEVWETMENSAHTLDWLEQEGFITVESKPTANHFYYSGTRLTLKGLTLLGYTPASAIDEKDNDTLINRAKRVFSRAAEQSATEVVGKLFMAAFRHMPDMVA